MTKRKKNENKRAKVKNKYIYRERILHGGAKI